LAVFFAVPVLLFLAVLFLAVPLLAALLDFLAGAFFAVDAVVFLAGAFFAVDDEEEVDGVEEVEDEDDDFLAGAFLAVVDFVVVVFFAAADFVVDAFLAVVVLAAPVFFAAVDFVAVAFEAAVFLLTPAALAALSVAAFAPLAAAARVSFGSFFAPETTALRSAPALNLGIAVFLALMRSPVRGLRTQRASRTRFSKEPKPVMATFSPLATSRVIVSSTDSRA
jgi:hypothetical protein